MTLPGAQAGRPWAWPNPPLPGRQRRSTADGSVRRTRRHDDGMTVDDPIVARLPASNEPDHLEQEEQRDEAAGQESKEQEPKHATEHARAVRWVGHVASRVSLAVVSQSGSRSVDSPGRRTRTSSFAARARASRAKASPASTEPQPHRPAREARNVERAPMDGDRRSRPDQPGGIDRGGRIEPLGTVGRTPATDGQQRHIDVSGKPRHLRVQRGIAGEVHAPRPFDEIADRARGGSQRPAAVAGGQRPDPDAAKVQLLVGGDFADRTAGDGRRRPQAARNDEQRVAGEAVPARRGRNGRDGRARSGPCRSAPGRPRSGAGPSRRSGPTRAPRTGSVRMRWPSSSMSIVA